MGTPGGETGFPPPTSRPPPTPVTRRDAAPPTRPDMTHWALSSSPETPMTNRPPIPQETVATRAAFRVGVKGMRYTENPDPGFDIPVATDNTPGPNERHFETIERLPGLSDPEAAYETGRALRMIGHILDSQGLSVEHGRHFLSQLVNAVLSFALRGESQPWGAEDTAFVFRETFKAAPTDAQRAYDAILDYARKRPIVKAR